MGWKEELGQQRTAQNTRCQRLALFFPPRGGRYNFSVPAANAEARVWPGRGTGRRGAPRSLNKKPRQLPKGAEREETKQKAHRVPPTKNPAGWAGSCLQKRVITWW